jgi:hypothetical protein
MLKLYHGGTSVCSVKARLALAEKGLEWTSQLLMLCGDQFDPRRGLPRDLQSRPTADARFASAIPKLQVTS